MNPIKKIKSIVAEKLDKLFTALFATAGSLFFAQFPQFLAQYLQRLGGHIDEAVLASKKYNLPDLVQRANDFKLELHTLNNAMELFKLPLFIIQAEWIIAKETFNNYTPGMTFNELGLYYLAAGFVIGLGLYGSIKLLLKKIFTSGKKGKPAAGMSPVSPAQPMQATMQSPVQPPQDF